MCCLYPVLCIATGKRKRAKRLKVPVTLKRFVEVIPLEGTYLSRYNYLFHNGVDEEICEVKRRRARLIVPRWCKGRRYPSRV